MLLGLSINAMHRLEANLNRSSTETVEFTKADKPVVVFVDDNLGAAHRSRNFTSNGRMRAVEAALLRLRLGPGTALAGRLLLLTVLGRHTSGGRLLKLDKECNNWQV